MINILTMFRQRRLPRQQNGAKKIPWHQKAGLNGFGTNAVDARREAARAGQIRQRQQHEAVRPREQARDNYLAAHGLEKSYGGRKVVKDVSVYVRRGEAVGLLGPNGAGKTTAFYMITGLVKADRGIVELDGYNVTGLHYDVEERAAQAPNDRTPIVVQPTRAVHVGLRLGF